jgi:hypothetical protein
MIDGKGSNLMKVSEFPHNVFFVFTKLDTTPHACKACGTAIVNPTITTKINGYTYFYCSDECPMMRQLGDMPDYVRTV